ncbi:MAG: HD-GYP domain-containing protein [Chloroflexi bacterium]|nr:HD-GYP domain-containing protein [Chloroflexota bacterium]
MSVTSVEQTGMQQQLLRYAHDLRETLRKERERSGELHRLSVALEEALESERRARVDLEWAHQETLLRLMLATRFKDEETGAHLARVSYFATALGTYLGLPGEQLRWIGAAATMHDIGKIGIPDVILLKAGRLSPDERQRMEAHTTIGAKLLGESKSELIQTACDIALTHHERWDGTGYPDGLKKEEIPVAGRIVMVADVYDALRSARPYKPAFSHDYTVETILNGSGRTRPEHFDPGLLEAFRALERDFEAIYQNSQVLV